MIAVRQKDSSLVPIGWQTGHMAGYALTSVVGFSIAIMFYLAMVHSGYHCYLYNNVLTVNEFSRETNRTVLSASHVWYRDDNCYNAFWYSLIVSVGSGTWFAFFLVFGRGGSSDSGSDHSKYFSEMMAGQWHAVLYAVLFNCWSCVQTIFISSMFTNGYLQFVLTVSYLPANSHFRNAFENSVRPYYIKTIVLFWCQSCLCLFNFLLIMARCVTGVDFVHDFDNSRKDQDQDEAPVAGPSNQIENKSSKIVLYNYITLDYVGSSRHRERSEAEKLTKLP